MKYVWVYCIKELFAEHSLGRTCLWACDQSDHSREGALKKEPSLHASTKSSKFGDGIMSMIDCKINLDRKPDPKGDRVILTFE